MNMADPVHDQVLRNMRMHLADHIDFGHLERYTMGEPALTRELLSTFCHEARMFVDEWRSGAMNSSQVECRALHRLKGAARAIGAFPLAEAAAWLEQLLREQAGRQDVADARDDLRAHLDALQDACRRWKTQNGA